MRKECNLLMGPVNGVSATCDSTGVRGRLLAPPPSIAPHRTDDAIAHILDKTPRQSQHNANLKELVLNHITTSRHEYPSIPEADFAPGRLEHSFDQAFTTWRGKFRAQDPSRREQSSTAMVEVEGG
jgi:hypothetical protein